MKTLLLTTLLISTPVLANFSPVPDAENPAALIEGTREVTDPSARSHVAWDRVRSLSRDGLPRTDRNIRATGRE